MNDIGHHCAQCILVLVLPGIDLQRYCQMSDSHKPGLLQEQLQDTQLTDIKESVTQIEKRFLRLTLFQTILSVAAVLTGIIALYAALTESYEVRKQTAASVWPYVQLTQNDTDTSKKAFVKISLDNVGVGPARMISGVVRYQGEYMRNWQDIINKLDSKAILGETYGKSSVSHRVLAPGESLVIFQTHESKLARLFQNALYKGELELSYCYCSIFDDCWIKPLANSKVEPKIELVEQCPDYGEDQFAD